jgi:hypothetical protein
MSGRKVIPGVSSDGQPFVYLLQTWCCETCGIATGSQTSVKRIGRTNRGQGYCYAEDRPTTFVMGEVSEGRLVRKPR